MAVLAGRTEKLTNKRILFCGHILTIKEDRIPERFLHLKQNGKCQKIIHGRMVTIQEVISCQKKGADLADRRTRMYGEAWLLDVPL